MRCSVLLVGLSMLGMLPAWSEDLQPDQVLFTYGWAEQTVETDDVRAILSFGGTDALPSYQIRVTDLRTDADVTETFPQTPGNPVLTAFNEARRCGKRVVFLTVRTAPAPFADISRYLMETHAFGIEPLAYLDTAPTPFEGIAFSEGEMGRNVVDRDPSMVGIECRTSRNGSDFGFSGPLRPSD